MSRKSIIIRLFILALCVGIYFFWKNQRPNILKLTIDKNEIDRSQGRSYADMLETAQKHVVSVYSTEIIQYLKHGRSSRDDLLRDFLGLPPIRKRNQGVETRKVPQGVGSGVIISEDGYIITNNHVISDKSGGEADEILVRLSDGKEYKASIVGRDPKTDIAVLKVNAKGLSFTKIADSNKARVGDIVFAIGNPMGVGLTVTKGIVSAKNRSIGIYGEDGYENFIQTDASINPGNSGGALVDVEGRLIGINSAIVSRSGGNVGIGFAIPSNLAVEITEQLTQSGRIKRKMIGIGISPLDEKKAQYYGINSNSVLITSVAKGSIAARSGLVPGDVITHIGNRPVKGLSDLRSSIAHLKSGTSSSLLIWRNNAKIRVDIVIE